MSVEIIKGDARSLPLPDDSVDLIVTSPPYWSLRSYRDAGEHYDGQIGAELTPAAYIDSLIDCTAEWMRVLKTTGSLWVNLGDKYAGSPPGGPQNGACGKRGTDGDRKRGHVRLTSPGRPATGAPPKSLIGLPWRYALRCIDDLGLILRAEIIWSKPNGLPESVTDRVRRSHETWFHFTRSSRYFSAVDAIREPHHPASVRISETAANKPGGYAPLQRAKEVMPGRAGETPQTLRPLNPLGKLPGSVWSIATQPLKVPAELGIDHFAAFPMEWPRRIISAWCPEGGTVLDPCGGTGTTALVAAVLGRHGITVDYSADYCRLAEWRINDPKQRERAARRPPVPL